MNWSVYIIQADDMSFYTGISTDVDRRFNQHLEGKGAKFFNGRKPVEIVFTEHEHSRSSASKREAEIKKLNRDEKLKLIKSN
ncbi:MAG: GIY-YIG nuclease family protein [Gammaproteobacteria bacterium]